jgi:hypothetical protein
MRHFWKPILEIKFQYQNRLQEKNELFDVRSCFDRQKKDLKKIAQKSQLSQVHIVLYGYIF